MYMEKVIEARFDCGFASQL